MAEVVYSGHARSDMADVWVWIADNGSVATADRVIERIERRIAALAQHPEMGPRRVDINERARVLVTERWLVLYALDNDQVQIVRVVDGVVDLTALSWEK